MIRFAISMLGGVWLVLQSAALPPTGCWALLAVSGLAVWFLPASVRPVLSGLLAGALVAGVTAERQLARRLPDELIGQELTVSGNVVGIPRHTPLRSVFRLQIIDAVPVADIAPRLVRVSWYRPAGALPRAGERWQFTVRLRAAVSLGNPGSFDYRRWLFRQGVDALATVRARPPPQRLAAAPGLHLDHLRETLAARMAALPGADDTVGLMQALALGVGHGVSDAQRDTLRASGTAHLLAISGLHIGLVAAWALALTGWLWRYCSSCQRYVARRTLALAGAAVAAFGYALCAGFALPTQRALLMLLTGACAVVTQRAVQPLRVLSVALVLILLCDPLAPLAAGFWLSFGTVGALLYLHQGRIQPCGRLRQLCAVHLRLGLVLLPATAWFFDSGSIIAPLANLLAVPLVGLLVVPLALLTLLLLVPLPALADVSLSLGQWLLAQLLAGLQQAMTLTAGSVPLSLPASLLLLSALGGVLLALAPAGIGVRRYALPLILPALWFNLVPRQVDGMEVHVLDVGQGLAVLVLTREHTLLYDTGDFRAPGVSQVESLILPYLRRQGRRSIDTIVISHSDRDHMAGWADLHRLFPEARWYAGQPELLPGTGATRCRAGEHWRRDGAGFAFLHPAAHDQAADNNLSCVLLVHLGAGRALLTGDIEAPAEALLARRAGVLPVTMMTAPHHGSRTSSSDFLLDTFRPRYVVFPAGQDNRYGFPHPDVCLRYTLRGIESFVTGKDGATVFHFRKQGLREPPESWWRYEHRIWHRSGE